MTENRDQLFADLNSLTEEQIEEASRRAYGMIRSAR